MMFPAGHLDVGVIERGASLPSLWRFPGWIHPKLKLKYEASRPSGLATDNSSLGLRAPTPFARALEPSQPPARSRCSHVELVHEQAPVSLL